jgi:hypothetical protein
VPTEITSPLVFSASEPLPDWDFVVTKPFSGPAITIRGDMQANGIGEFVGKIRLRCNWMSAGVMLERLDNACVEGIKVERSVGLSILVQSCRQSVFQSLQATEAYGVEAIKIANAWPNRGDSSNANLFSFVSVYACGSQVALQVSGNSVRGLGTCRNNQFGHVFLHTTWQKQLDRIPSEMKHHFLQQEALLYMENCEDIGFERLTMTLGEDTENAILAERINRCKFAGRVLVYRPEQFVAPPGNVDGLFCVVRR